MDKKILFLIFLILFNCKDPVSKSKKYIDKGMYEEAESILLYSLKKGKEEPEIYLLLGEINIKKKFYLSALSYFEKVIDKNKYKKRLLKNLRDIYLETKDKGPEIARRSLFLIYLLEPENLTFEEKKFIALYFIEREQIEGKNFVEKVLEEKFDDELFLEYIKNLFDKNEYREILSLYKKFSEKINVSKLNLNITFYIGLTYFEYGKKYFEEQKIDSSYTYLSKYITMKEPPIYLPKAYFLRGKINLEKGDTVSAYYDFRKVLEILPFKNSGIAQEAREIIKELKLKGF